MRIDRADEPDGRPAPGTADTARPTGTDQPAGHDARRDADSGADRDGDWRGNPAAGPDGATGAGARAARSAEHRAAVDAAYRAHAIDQGYERVREIEHRTVTPAMRRIEAEDPGRHLAGLEHRLKGKDRLTEKINEAMDERGRTVADAFSLVKDAIRYTLCCPEDHYAEAVYADCERIEDAGFERVDRKNSWAGEEYKGINSRWRVSGTSQIFEVQFHTQASLDAKEETHWAYERLRALPNDDAEVGGLHTYQREVTSKVPIPPGALDIPDYP